MRRLRGRAPVFGRHLRLRGNATHEHVRVQRPRALRVLRPTHAETYQHGTRIHPQTSTAAGQQRYFRVEPFQVGRLRFATPFATTAASSVQREATVTQR